MKYILFALITCGCITINDPSRIIDTTACDDAYETLIRLECSEWLTTPGGVPFNEACREAMIDGRDWCPRAISRINSCDDVEIAYSGELGGDC